VNVCSCLAEQHFEKVLSWLSPRDFSAYQADVFNRREPDTGVWFLESDEFQRWLGKAEPVLFCTGKPGTGKTSLASLAIDYLKHLAPPEGEIYGIAWIYCSYKERASQTASSLICNLTKQLVKALAYIPVELTKIFQNHSETKMELPLSESTRAFRAVVNHLSRTFIIIDALDECDEGSRERLLEQLRHIVPEIQILATSRHISRDESGFKNALRVEISAQREDLEIYVDSRLESETRLKQHIQGDSKLKAMIKSTLLERSQGM
jgi:Cdc6-like AAA superfamily ATPase